MRTRLLMAFLLALPAVPLLSADLPDLRSGGKLRVLVSADEEPLFFRLAGAGEPGFERELMEGFASLQGLKLEVVPVQRFETILSDLLAGRGDLISGIIDNDERRQQIDFTSEVLPARHVAVACAPASAPQTLEQLRRERVGTIRGTTWIAAATDAGIKAASLKTFPEMGPLLEALCSGRIGAAVMSVSDATLGLRQEPRLRPGVLLGRPESAAWGVRKTDPALLKALDEYLGNARRGQTWSRLAVKYFGNDALTILGRASR
jgi:ABC-type amino acid transport substrate-binding protein